VLRDDAADRDDNTTRFLVIGASNCVCPQPSGNDRTLILFGVKHSTGSLTAALGEFSSRGINMESIESYADPEKAWVYNFFAELQGHAHDPEVCNALEALEAQCTFVTVLGSFPVAKGSK
jgi:chorismate mutase / prephenate dehydratase